MTQALSMQSDLPAESSQATTRTRLPWEPAGGFIQPVVWNPATGQSSPWTGTSGTSGGTGTSGTSSVGYRPAAQNLLPQAVKKPFSIAGATGFTTEMQGGTSPEDALRAMMADRQALEAQIVQKGLARTGATSQLKKSAGEADVMKQTGLDQATALRADLQTAVGGGLQSILEAKGVAQGLGPAAEARGAVNIGAAEAGRTEAIDEATGLKKEALEEFTSDVANTMQLNRATIDQSWRDYKKHVTDEAGQRGLGPDSPEVLGLLFQADSVAMGQLGMMGSQLSATYNVNRAQLRTTYDQTLAQVRGVQDQLAASVRGEAAKYTGLSEAQGAELTSSLAKMDADLRMASVQMTRGINADLQSVLSSAAQIGIAAGEGMGNIVRDWAPEIAGWGAIMALAAGLTSDMKQAANWDTMTVMGGSGISTPSGSQLLGGYQLRGGSAGAVAGRTSGRTSGGNSATGSTTGAEEADLQDWFRTG